MVGVGIAMDEFCQHALGLPRFPTESPFMGLPMDFLEDGMCSLCLFQVVNNKLRIMKGGH
jgi:hypothetical protein